MTIYFLLFGFGILHAASAVCDFGNIQENVRTNIDPKNAEVYKFTGLQNLEMKPRSTSTPGVKFICNFNKAKDEVSVNLEIDIEKIRSQCLVKLIDVKIDFTCNEQPSDKRTSHLVFFFNPVNDHAPAFIDASGMEITEVTYTVPMPLAAIPINLLGEEIRVRDIDLANMGIDFTSDNQNFEVEEKTVDSLKKVFTVNLLPSIPVLKEVSLKITASDRTKNTDSVKSTELTIHIKKNAKLSPVEFNKLHYNGNYNLIQNELENVDVISINSNDIIPKLSGDFSECFSSLNTHGIVTISKNTCAKLPHGESRIVLDLNAELKNEVVATAIVELKIIESADLYITFPKLSNKGQIDKNAISLDAIKIQTNVKSEILFNFDGKYGNLFKASLMDEQMEVKVELKEDSTIPDKTNFIILTLIATSMDNPEVEGKTVIILKGEDEESEHYIKFKEVLYEGSIDDSVVSHKDIVLDTDLDEDKETLEFDLEGTFKSEFKKPKLIGGKVNIELTETANFPKNLGFITFAITVKLPKYGLHNSAGIVFSIIEDKPSHYIKFDDSVYKGIIHGNRKTINYDNIKIDTDLKQDDIDLSFMETNVQKLLKPSLDLKKVIIDLRLETEIPLETKTIVAILIASSKSNAHISAQTMIIFDVEFDTIEFSEIAYLGTIDNSQPAARIDKVIEIITGFTSNAIDLKMSADDDIILHFHDPVLKNKKVTISLKDSLSTDEDIISLTLTASAKDYPRITAETVIVFQIQQDIPELTFEQDRYKGILENDNHSFIMKIELLTNIEDEITLKLTGDLSDRFIVSTSDNREVQLKHIGTNPFPTEVTLLIFTLTASYPIQNEKIKDKCAIIIEVDHGSDMNNVVLFEEHDFIFTRNIRSLPWNVVKFVARSGFSNDEFIYTITTKSLPAEISISTNGLLQVSKGISEGLYEVQVKATSRTNDKLTGVTQVVLSLVRSSALMTEFSHMVVTVEEDQETPVTILQSFQMNHEKYGFCLENIYPDISRIPDHSNKLAVVDGNIVATKLLREAPYMQKMAVPQFTITSRLRLLNDIPQNGFCPDSQSLRSNRSTYEIRDDLIGGITMPTNTPHLLDQTVITLLIGDVNNNAPQMLQKNIVVGYPVQSILSLIQPSCLTKVSATDLDSVETGFGKITYISRNPEYIRVDSKTGVVYPTDAIFHAPTHSQFKVTAYDNDMKDSTHFDEAIIEVKFIGKENIAILSIECDIGAIEGYLESLSTESVKLHVLATFAMYINLPSTSLIRQKRDETIKNPKKKIDVVLYGMNDGNPMKLEDLKKVFANENIVDFQSVAALESNISGNEKTDNDTTGLIIAVSILGVAVVVLVLVGLIYWLRLRQRGIPYVRKSDSLDSMVLKSDQIDNVTDDKQKLDIDNSILSIESKDLENKTIESNLKNNDSIRSLSSQLSLKRDIDFIFETNVPVKLNNDNPSIKSGASRRSSTISITFGKANVDSKSVTFNADVQHGVLYEDVSNEEKTHI